MATSLDNPGWLQWMASLMEGASRQTHAATLPPDRYFCILDELPLHLIPQRCRSLADSQEEKLYLNPDCAFYSAGEMPEELASFPSLLAGFALDGTIAWVRDPVTKSLLPFWMSPALESMLRDLRSHGRPATPPQDMCSLLVAANILMSEARIEQRLREYRKKIEKQSSLFRETGYVPIADLIHPFHVAALRRYYRYRIRTGQVALGDKQSSRRYVAYNDPVARFFHHQISKRLSEIAGEPLKPSYVYLASYLGGAELKKHTDREQCDFSITLCLDFSPEPELASPWPIRLDTPSGTVTVYQGLGDGLAYRGTRLPHYRDRLAEGRTSTSIFFHYVAADFAGSLD